MLRDADRKGFAEIERECVELAIAAGCALTSERFVVVDDRQQTTVPGVYAAGELTGVDTAALRAAADQGAGGDAEVLPIPGVSWSQRSAAALETYSQARSTFIASFPPGFTENVFSVIFFDRVKADDPVGATSVHLMCGVMALALG